MSVVEQEDTTGTATRVFLERVAQIPQARVQARYHAPGVHSVRVYLPSRDSGAWTQVRDLEAAVLTEHPRARLDIWLSEERDS